MSDHDDDNNGISKLRDAAREFKAAVADVRNLHISLRLPEPSQSQLPSDAYGWNFHTFEKYINQRFTDLGLNLRERYEAQQLGLAAALAAAEKAVTAALIAAEKAVDKAEGAQQLRNIAQNEFRSSLSDLSKLMWTRQEGTSALDALRREVLLIISSLEAKSTESVVRITAIENRTAGLSAAKADNQGNTQNNYYVIATIGAIVSVIISIAALVWTVITHH